MKVAVIIPAFCPDSFLVTLVEQLGQRGIPKIVVIDDGSGPEYQEIFSRIKRNPKAIVLQQESNRGKGAALKTGFTYILAHHQDLQGVVTADADGQHDIEDILRIAESLAKQNASLLLGVREFKSKIPPIRLLGNTITRWILKFLFGIPLSDTQTGLRGIPLSLLKALESITYDRYEFELEMLLYCKKEKIPIREIPIRTIYPKDGSSHFNPLIDSMRIYFVLFRYVITSLLTALVDYAVFLPIVGLTDNILLSTFISRAVALGVGYTLLRWVVFQSAEKAAKTFPKYIALVLISGTVSAELTKLFAVRVHLPILQAKILSELSIYFLVFWVQKTFIFIKKQTST